MPKNGDILDRRIVLARLSHGKIPAELWYDSDMAFLHFRLKRDIFTFQVEFMPKVKCPTCENESRLILQRNEVYSYHRCPSCGLVFASPSPTAEELNAFYNGFLFRKPDTTKIASLKRSYSQMARRILDDARAHSGKPIRSVLDFGGGIGFFADAFRDHVDRVTLYEVDPQAVSYALTMFPGRFEVVNKEVQESTSLEGTYDLVFANQVIEHFAHLDDFYSKIRPACHPDTIVIIVTSNNKTLEHLVRPDIFWHYARAVTRLNLFQASLRLVTDSWMCCDPPRHLFAFSDDSLKESLKKHQFELLGSTTQYTNQTYYALNLYSDFRFGSLKQAVWSFESVFCQIGLRLMRMLDTQRSRGSDLIAFARPFRETTDELSSPDVSSRLMMDSKA